MDKFPALMRMVEDYCLGKIPWGPWDARSVHRWAAEGQKERETLKKIVRAGIIPLQMYGGGVQTYQTRDLKFEDGWKPILPEWAKSKGRAYFDFVVLFPGGAREGNWLYREQDQGRAKEDEVLVAGKTMEAWKEDLVLEEYIDKPWIDVPLLVHVEVLDSKPVAPDQVVLGLLEQARVGDMWPEWRMEESLEELYTQLRVDWKS